MAALEGEVRHLKHKVRGHQEETCQLSANVRDIERLIDQKEKEQQQLHDQLRIGRQQVRKNSLSASSAPPLQEGSIDQSNSDLEAVKQAHKIDAERWSQRSVLLYSRLKQNKPELSQTQGRPKDRESGGHEAQGQFKSAARSRGEGKSFVCCCQSIEP